MTEEELREFWEGRSRWPAEGYSVPSGFVARAAFA